MNKFPLPSDTLDIIKDMPFKLHVIKKGGHRSGLSIPKIHFGLYEWSICVIFTESCLYDQLEPEDDLNKLWGYSYGFHHENSVRVAWRPSRIKEGVIELHYYVYKNGKRYTGLVGNIFVNKPYLIRINNRINNGRLIFPNIGVSLYLGIYDERTHDVFRLIGIVDIPAWFKNKWGYELRLYFGGYNDKLKKDTPSPRDMGIYLLE